MTRYPTDPMTPTEQATALATARAALVTAFWGFDFDPPEAGRIADHVLAALAQQGLVIARAEDARDGEALRELREACSPLGLAWQVASDVDDAGPTGLVWFDVWRKSSGVVAGAADTIAAAADAARAALGAGR